MCPRLSFGRLLAFSTIALAALLAPVSGGEELPPEIQVDRLLVQAEREIEDGEHLSAVFTFEWILAVSNVNHFFLTLIVAAELAACRT